MCDSCYLAEERERQALRAAAHADGLTVACPAEAHYVRPGARLLCACFACTHEGCRALLNTTDGIRKFCNLCKTCKEHCHHYCCANCGEVRDTIGKPMCDSCSYCPNCCRCKICPEPGCGNKHTNRCETCNKCVNHCEHIPCRSCGRRVGRQNICKACNCCYQDCCRARQGCENPLIGVWFKDKNPLIFHDSGADKPIKNVDDTSDRFGAGFTRNRLSRMLSCEIEIDDQRKVRKELAESLQKLISDHKDNVVSDGSLRGNLSREINTMPANGNKFVDYIDALGKGLGECGAVVSDVCGLHVHVSTRGYTTYDLRRLITLYQKVERAMYELCHPNRLSNSYSKICGSAWFCYSRNPKDFREEIIGKLYNPNQNSKRLTKENESKNFGAHKKRVTGGKSHPNRYRALNLHSHFLRGTIEFRHHEGTIKPVEIKNWSLVCGWLVESALNMGEAAIERLGTNPYEVLIAIVPKTLHSWMLEKWRKYGSDIRTTSEDYDHIWQNEFELMQAKQYSQIAERQRSFITAAQRLNGGRR